MWLNWLFTPSKLFMICLVKFLSYFDFLDNHYLSIITIPSGLLIRKNFKPLTFLRLHFCKYKMKGLAEFFLFQNSVMLNHQLLQGWWGLMLPVQVFLDYSSPELNPQEFTVCTSHLLTVTTYTFSVCFSQLDYKFFVVREWVSYLFVFFTLLA